MNIITDINFMRLVQKCMLHYSNVYAAKIDRFIDDFKFKFKSTGYNGSLVLESWRWGVTLDEVTIIWIAKSYDELYRRVIDKINEHEVKEILES